MKEIRRIYYGSVINKVKGRIMLTISAMVGFIGVIMALFTLNNIYGYREVMKSYQQEQQELESRKVTF